MINFGILPLIFDFREDYESLQKDDVLEWTGLQKGVEEGTMEVVRRRDGHRISVHHDLSARERKIISHGGAINYYREQQDIPG